MRGTVCMWGGGEKKNWRWEGIGDERYISVHFKKKWKTSPLINGKENTGD
jgi:hypothetical protein